MENKMKPTVETGAMTLVLLVQKYRSQMIALLLKNGITVPSGASVQQIATIMANLLKISKSFAKDLNNFIQNPKVLESLMDGLQSAEYFRASGFAGKQEGNAQYFRADGFMNYEGNRYGIPDVSFKPDEDEDPVLSSASSSGSTGGFWSGLNLGSLLSQGLDAFGKLDKNKTDREIAKARAKAGQISISTDDTDTGGSTSGGTGSGGKKSPDDEGISTTTIVVLSLVGIAVVGTIIYFVARPKE